MGEFHENKQATYIYVYPIIKDNALFPIQTLYIK
jgi:hypothetical protein